MDGQLDAMIQEGGKVHFCHHHASPYDLVIIKSPSSNVIFDRI